MTMTITVDKNILLTAYNKDVQRYLTGGCTTAKKNIILSYIEEKVISVGKSFEKLFPSKSKRNQVMDNILFLISGTGICKVESKTLAEKVGCSVRTVSDAIKNLKETGEILVGGLADGKNKYVFVLKSHPNFKAILKEVFFIDNAEQIAEQIAEQKNLETVGAVSVEGVKSSPNYNNLFISKQEKDIIRDSIENEVKTSKDYQQYFVSEMQNKLYHQILASPFPKEIMDNAGLLALRTGDINEEGYLKAYQTVFKLATYITDGVDVKHLLALFTSELEAFKKVKVSNELENTDRSKAKFYNWLEERE